MEGADQQLFLMEFLVDRVNVPSIRAMHDEMLPVSTCVCFQILNLPPINICQEASAESCACTGDDSQSFRKGKSCLFALPSIVLEKPLHSFPVTMSVYKRLPPGVLPDVMLIGSHKIEARDLFNALLNRYVFEAGNPCRTMKQAFKITTATGQHVGSVTAFIRVSCFGKKIVTQFQIPHNKKPYLFKGTKDSPVYQCKRIPSGTIALSSPRCNCKRDLNGGGGGEAAPRTCCPEPNPRSPRSPAKYRPPDYGPRPCCPSLRRPLTVCPLPSSYPSDSVNSAGSPGPCSPPPRSTSGCCRSSSRSPHLSVPKEPAVRECGCIVKEDRACNCGAR